MSKQDKVLDQLSTLLDKLNQDQPRKKTFLDSIMGSPVVITVVGGLLLTWGSLYVTKQFQLSEQKTMALSSFEENFPARLAKANNLGKIKQTLSDQGCVFSENVDKILQDPFVFGLTGKTCREAEALYREVESQYLAKPINTSIARVRAVFKTPAVDDEAKILNQRMSSLETANDAICIVELYEALLDSYERLLELAISEIEGGNINISSFPKRKHLSPKCV
jgi:hypothetical protein